MRRNPWLPQLNNDMPASEAARRVLVSRFKTVASALPLALTAPDETRHVHKLRVATRRASAALKIFRDCLPKKQYSHCRELLRTIRRSAGEARNWDVFLDHLDQSEALQAAPTADTLNFLTGLAFRERDLAQVVIVGMAAERQRELNQLWKTLPEVMKVRKEPTVAALSQRIIAEQSDEIIRRIEEEPGSAEERHALRIAIKRLRYTIETFAQTIPADSRDALLKAAKHLQDSLGTIHDSHIMAERLTLIERSLKTLRPTVLPRLQNGLTRFLREVRQRERTEFRKLTAGYSELMNALHAHEPKIAER